MAAQFLASYSVNGMEAWKAEDGESGSKIAKRETKKHFSQIEQKAFPFVRSYELCKKDIKTLHKDAFIEEQKRLTIEGNIVISVGLFGHSGDTEIWEGISEDSFTKIKEMLDDMHKRKIYKADEIFVINVGGYIGSSTRSEIEYAEAAEKRVLYIEPVKM